jgi:hypothetical protein
MAKMFYASLILMVPFRLVRSENIMYGGAILHITSPKTGEVISGSFAPGLSLTFAEGSELCHAHDQLFLFLLFSNVNFLFFYNVVGIYIYIYQCNKVQWRMQFVETLPMHTCAQR